MRRILFSILLVVAFAVTAYAGPDQVVLQIDNCWTGTVQTVRETESIPVYGYVDQIDVICKNSTTTGTVEICTVTNDWYDIEATILTVAGITASDDYQPRFPTHYPATGSTQTNDVARYYLYGQKLKLQAYSFSATNENIAVRIKLNTE
jgi:hypothetical protein